MKRPDLFFTALAVPLDALAILSAAFAAFALRLSPLVVEIRPVAFDLTPETYSRVVGVVIPLWIFIFALSGLYRFSERRVVEELKIVLLSSASTIAIVFATLFFSLSAFESRFIVLAGWGLAVLFLWTERLLVHGLRRSMLLFGIGLKRAILIGTSDTARVLEETFGTHLRFGTKVVGVYKTFDAETEERLRTMARHHHIDEIIFADAESDHDTLARLKTFTDTEHLRLRYSADVFTVGSARVEANAVAGIPLMTIKKTTLDGWGAIYKRGFDIIASLLLITLLSPILLLTALSILIETGRPILFRNERVGEANRTFNTLKFRSMYAKWSVGAQKGLGNQEEALALEEDLIKKKSLKGGPVYKIKQDPRITPFGRFIRKFSIDELPQLFNVLFGSMSLVGPRPHQPREVEKYLPHHRRVHTIRPGITGLAQISGRSDLEFEEEVRLDTFYIEHWSPWIDLIILLKTPFVVLFRKGAY